LEMGVLQTICPAWSGTVILLISAFQEARITGVSHQCLVNSIDFSLSTYNKSKKVYLRLYVSMYL
jgi:hypothetical protein